MSSAQTRLTRLFAGVGRRLAVSYAVTFALALLLLGPVLYLASAQQLTDASDGALRLAAQRQALLAIGAGDVTLGINPSYVAPAALALRDVFYLPLTPAGRVRSNPEGVHDDGLPDVVAARDAARLRHGVFSTLHTRAAGDLRLFTVPILRAGRLVALLQAGHSVRALNDERRALLELLLGLGSAAIVVATAGGFALVRLAMRPLHLAFAAQRAFVADASHELRTPLTLMRTNAEVLLAANVLHEPDDRALVEDIVSGAAHMGRLLIDHTF